jgi:hypothetical protein
MTATGSTPSLPDPSLPDGRSRWRCGQCGNLTRFDLTRVRRTREYVHVDLAGEPSIDEVDVLAEEVVSLLCRWCGSSNIETVPRPPAG